MPEPHGHRHEAWDGAAADGIAARVRSGDYQRWLNHVQPAAGCTAPVRLVSLGTPRVDSDTGDVLGTLPTDGLPDGVIYKACGNRRASVCPHCAEIYRGDAYQLVLAGLAGGKSIPVTVAGHPAVFATLTAPSFGVVHTHRRDKRGKTAPCRARRTPDHCPHGVDLRCLERHDEHAEALGRPLCPDCYDYRGHAVFNAFASELWRRTTITANRLLDKHATAHDAKGTVRLAYGKVAEFQRRGLVHFHTIVRLDGIDPDDKTAIIRPSLAADWANVFTLARLLRAAIENTSYTTPAHPLNRAGWTLTWGEQLDIRPVHATGGATITGTEVVDNLDGNGRRRILSTTAVAGYIAKYATKATEAAGHSSARITAETIGYYTTGTHIGRLIDACWTIGAPVIKLHRTGDTARFAEVPDKYRRLRRWAHMLGYGGHFFTKSRRYTTTFKALRQARADWRAAQYRTVDHITEDEHLHHIGQLIYAGKGWHTTADATLAQTSADLARIRRQTAREEVLSSTVI